MYLAIDVGGTKINLSLFRKLDPESLSSESILKTNGNFCEDVDQISKTIKNKNVKIKAIGVSLPGFVVDETKGIASAANLPDWEGKDLKKILSKNLDTKDVFLLHDGKAHAMAELIFKKKKNDFLFIAWGTGIGATYIRNVAGKVIAQQVEFGFQYVNNQAIEKLVGGNSFEDRFKKDPSKLSKNDWSTIVEDFSTGLANILALNYPPEIIWGGGVVFKNKEVVSKIMDQAHKKYPYWSKPNFNFSSFGENGGVIGALAEIKYQLKK